MRLALLWQGPIGAGHFPDDPVALEALMAPGVYLRLKRYVGGHSVSYVGQSKNVLNRIDQHLTAMLSLQMPLRDDRGRLAFGGDLGARLAAYNDPEAVAACAAREVARTSFVVAWCDEDFTADRLNLVEGALKTRLEARIAAGAGLAACENIQNVPVDSFADVHTLEQEFGTLKPEFADLVVRALGDQPIVLGDSIVGAAYAY